MDEFILTLRALLPLYLLPFIIGYAPRWKTIGLFSRWWFGVMTIGFFLVVVHALNVGEKYVWFGLGGMLLICLTLAAKRIVEDRQLGSGENTNAFSVHVLLSEAVMFFLLATVYVYTVNQPILTGHWDGLVIWLRKVKGLYHWLPFAESPFPGDPYINYPNLGPMWEMIMMRTAGSPVEYLGRLAFPTFYVFWILALSALIPRGKNKWAIWSVPFVGILFFDRLNLTSGYQDLFVMIAAGMAALHLSLYYLARCGPANETLEKTEHTHGFLGFFFAGTLCFIKNEGTVIAVVLAAAFLTVFLLTHRPVETARRLRGLIFPLIVFAAMIPLWTLLLVHNHINPENISGPAFSKTGILRFYENMDRLPHIARYLTPYFREQGVVFTAAFLISFAAARAAPAARRALLFLWLAWAYHVTAVVVIFLATQLRLELHLSLAFDRLMQQHTFLYATAMVLSSGYLLKEAMGYKEENLSR